MRALQYDGTPLENAQSFKEQGNEMAKGRRWKDGQEFYTRAILILQSNRVEREKSKEEAPEKKASDEVLEKGREVPERLENVEAVLEETCLVNRALCNLELSMQTPRAS